MRTATSIDMFTPAQASHKLEIDDQALLALVNSGQLPAYNLDGQIRFKIADVQIIGSIPQRSVAQSAA